MAKYECCQDLRGLAETGFGKDVEVFLEYDNVVVGGSAVPVGKAEVHRLQVGKDENSGVYE